LPFVGATGSGARAQAAAAATPATPPVRGAVVRSPTAVDTAAVPDVQIVVTPDLAHSTWIVAAVYPHVVPRAVAVARAQAVLTLSGWAGGAVDYQNQTLVSIDPHRAGTPPRMSSATFSTPADIVDWRTGGVLLEPFVRAYRDVRRLNVLFLVPYRGFIFHGPRRYSDANVDISLVVGPGAYTYVVRIKNNRFGALGLPVTEPVTPAPAAPRSPDGLPIGSGILLGLVALAAAALAYVGAQRWGAGRSVPR
jgi:hypothetical protein